MNTDLEEIVSKAKIFFKEVIIPELMNGHIKKGVQEASLSHSIYQQSVNCPVKNNVPFYVASAP
jgi:hypothetical protein